MALRLFDLGNVLTTAENILNARWSRNPENPRNVLAQANVDQMQSGGDLGLTPVYGVGPQGNINMFQLSNRPGTPPQRVNLGQGISPATGPVNRIDVGDSIEIRDRFTNQLIQKIPKQLKPSELPKHKEAVAGASERGKLEAKAEAELPAKLEKSELEFYENVSALDTIDRLLSAIPDSKDLNLSYAYGRKNVAPDFIKPTEWVDAEADRDQVVSMLQLAAAKKLKGQGQITENERLMLARAATTLANPLISQKAAAREMRRVRAIFARAKGREGAKLGKEENIIDWNDL